MALGIKGFWRGYRHGFNQEWRGKGDPQYARLLREAKVDVWYHSLAMGAVMRGQTVAESRLRLGLDAAWRSAKW